MADLSLEGFSQFKLEQIPEKPWYVQGLVFLVFAVLGAIAYFNTLGEGKDIYRLKSERARLMEEVKKKSILAEHLDVYQKRKGDLEKQLALLEQVIPDSTSDDFQDLLGLIANDFGVSYKWEKVPDKKDEDKPQDDESNLAVLSYSITLTGNYHKVAQFLGELAKLKQLLVLENLHMIPRQGRPGVSLTATLKSYSLAPQIPKGESHG